MDKKIKLWVGIALVGVAAYLILKPKTPKTSASNDPKCKDDEELVDDTPCPECIAPPCPCPKICKPKARVSTGGLSTPTMEDVQTESFSGF